MEETPKQNNLREGFERLAFGDVTDAVRLLFAEEINPRTLKKMDLFNVAEIKRMKGGGMEIKFADRLKALQCLEQLRPEDGSDSGALYQALEASASMLREEDDS